MNSNNLAQPALTAAHQCFKETGISHAAFNSYCIQHGVFPRHQKLTQSLSYTELFACRPNRKCLHDSSASRIHSDSDCISVPPPLPSLVSFNPPTNDNQAISSATSRLDAYLPTLTNETDIERLVFIVGTSAGPVWSRGYGVARANETLPGSPPDTDTIYRLGSIIKVFTALKTMLLCDHRPFNL